MGMASANPIRPLPPDVLSQIRSSITITSLNEVVLNLVKNSLDSNASNIEITVDYSRGSCAVEDNGLGIAPVEFSERGGLGKLHHTSKSFQCAETHGKRGSFLASLSALSLLSITSHHHQHRSHNTLTMHQSKVIARQIPASAEHRIAGRDYGTNVTVRDLFGTMPVRVRQRASEPAVNEKDWQNLRKSLIGLLLAWPHPVSITLRDGISSQQNMRIRSATERKDDRTLGVSYFCSILSQALLISPSEKEFWVATSGSTSTLLISGAISTKPCPHKNVQFLSFYVHAISDCQGSSFLYDHVNRLFAMSSFGNEEDETLDDAEMRKRSMDARYKQEGYTTKQLKSSKKGPNKWPMFYLKIEPQNRVPSLGEDAADQFLDEKAGYLKSVMELLEAIVVGFLKEHHFRIQSRGRKAKHVNFKEPEPKSEPEVRNRREMTPVKRTASRLDLGTGVKIPSFSQTLSDGSDSPFHTWTRIKRGQTRTAQTGPETSSVTPTDKTEVNEDSSSAKPASSSVPATSARKGPLPAVNGRKNSTKSSGTKDRPLIDSNGRVIRLPFDVEDHNSSQKTTAAKQSTDQMGNNEDNSDAELVSWIDPISKDKSFICRRTGLVMAPERLVPRADSNSPTTIQLPSLIPRTMSALRDKSLGDKSKEKEEPSDWVKNLLKSWENPVFRPAEAPIPQISIEGPNMESQQILHGRHATCSNADIDRAFQQTLGGPSGRLTKEALRNAEIISQVDKKFVLIKMSTRGTQTDSAREHERDLLVLVDQHAADERCRVEELLRELCTNPLPQALEIPITFEISDLEYQLFRNYADNFGNWGISYDLSQASKAALNNCKVIVRGLPSGIIERCRIEPKILINLMRTEVWRFSRSRGKVPVPDKSPTGTKDAARDWFTKLRECPEGMVDIINSRSCRSAIMFNDELSIEQLRTWATIHDPSDRFGYCFPNWFK